jgi:hypothetical protein
MARRLIGLVLVGAISLTVCGPRDRGSRTGSVTPSPGGTPSPRVDGCDFSAYQPLRGSIEGPVVRKRVQPAFPSVARIDHLEGVVWVDVLVDGQGDVVRACATQGPALLRPPSEEAALGWKFEPLLLNGVARPYVHRIAFEYRLTETGR